MKRIVNMSDAEKVENARWHLESAMRSFRRGRISGAWQSASRALSMLRKVT